MNIIKKKIYSKQKNMYLFVEYKKTIFCKYICNHFRDEYCLNGPRTDSLKYGLHA